MKHYIVIAMLAVVAACTPMQTPKQAMIRVNKEFVGRDAGEFFVSYGSAVSSKPTHDRGAIYRWISLEPHGGANDIYHPYLGGHYSIPADDANGEMITGYCEISIRVNKDDQIEKFTIVNDSIGKFSGSRCAEIFGQPGD
jgi:hypothetical protein